MPGADRSTPADWWARQSLWVRSWLVVCGCIAAAATVRLSLAWQHERDLAVQAAERAAVVGRAVAPLLLARAAEGDVHGAGHLLRQLMQGAPSIRLVRWHGHALGDGAEVQIHAQPPPAGQVPAWFEHALDAYSLPWSGAVDPQQPRFGMLELHPQTAMVAIPAWRRMREQATVIVLVVAAASLLLALTMRRSMRGLAALTRWASEFGASRRGRPPTPDLRGCTAEVRALAEVLADAAQHIDSAERELQQLALHDPVTGLPNRQAFVRALGAALAEGRPASPGSPSATAVCVFDIDRFGELNQRLGGPAGDALLVSLGHEVAAALRDGDLLASLGGDEFAVALRVTDDTDAKARLVQLLERVARERAVDRDRGGGGGGGGGERVRCTACAGWTCSPPDPAQAEHLLRAAQGAMVIAKRLGHGRIERHDPLVGVVARRRIEAERELLQAVRQGELRLMVQPKVDMRRGEVVGAESLVRWQHPSRGLLGPDQFLPEAADGAAAIALDEWVLEHSLSSMSQWRASGARWPLAVNVSAAQFRDPGFPDRLAAALHRHLAVRPDELTIEVVESSALGDLDATASTIAHCKALGVRVAIDDFGVGYASLSYLRCLPADQVKIDRSFVIDMLDSPTDRSLVEAVIALARVFDREVVAEGVESAEHGVLLMRLGCDLAQGYGIARPMPASAFAGWARQWQPDPTWRLWGSRRWSLDDLPVLTAQLDHVAWVNQVLAVLEGRRLGLRNDELADPTRCRFGRWYHGIGWRHYGESGVAPAAQREVFARMAPVHVEVHRLGAALVQAHAAGDLDRAGRLAGELLQARDTIVALATGLQRSMFDLVAPAAAGEGLHG